MRVSLGNSVNKLPILYTENTVNAMFWVEKTSTSVLFTKIKPPDYHIYN